MPLRVTDTSTPMSRPCCLPSSFPKERSASLVAPQDGVASPSTADHKNLLPWPQPHVSDDARPFKSLQEGLQSPLRTRSVDDSEVFPPHPQTRWAPYALPHSVAFSHPADCNGLRQMMPLLLHLKEVLAGVHASRRVSIYLGGSAAQRALGLMPQGSRPHDLDPLMVVEAFSDTGAEALKALLAPAVRDYLRQQNITGKVVCTILGPKGPDSRSPLLMAISGPHLAIDIRVVAADVKQKLFDLPANAFLIDLLNDRANATVLPGTQPLEAWEEARLGLYTPPVGLKRDGLRRLWHAHTRGYVPNQSLSGLAKIYEGLLTAFLDHLHPDPAAGRAELSMQRQIFLTQRLMPQTGQVAPAVLINALMFFVPFKAHSSLSAAFLKDGQSAIEKLGIQADAKTRALLELLTTSRGARAFALWSFLQADVCAQPIALKNAPSPWRFSHPLGSPLGVTRFYVPQLGGFVVIPHTVATWMASDDIKDGGASSVKELGQVALGEKDDATAVAFLLGNRSLVALKDPAFWNSHQARHIAAKKLIRVLADLKSPSLREAWTPRLVLASLRLTDMGHAAELLAPILPLPSALQKVISGPTKHAEQQDFKKTLEALWNGPLHTLEEARLWKEASRHVSSLHGAPRKEAWLGLLRVLSEASSPRVDNAEVVAHAIDHTDPGSAASEVERGEARFAAFEKILKSPLRSQTALLQTLVSRERTSFACVVRYLTTTEEKPFERLSEAVAARLSQTRVQGFEHRQIEDDPVSETLVGLLLEVGGRKVCDPECMHSSVWYVVGAYPHLVPQVISWTAQLKDSEGRLGPGREAIENMTRWWLLAEHDIARLLACEALVIEHPMAISICRKLAASPKSFCWKACAGWLEKKASWPVDETSPEFYNQAALLKSFLIQEPVFLERVLRHIKSEETLLQWLDRIVKSTSKLSESSSFRANLRVQTTIAMDGLATEMIRRDRPILLFQAIAIFLSRPNAASAASSILKKLTHSLVKHGQAPRRNESFHDVVTQMIGLVDQPIHRETPKIVTSLFGSWLPTLCRVATKEATRLLVALKERPDWAPLLGSPEMRPCIDNKDVLGWLEERLTTWGDQWAQTIPEWLAHVVSDFKEFSMAQLASHLLGEQAPSDKVLARVLGWLQSSIRLVPMVSGSGDRRRLHDIFTQCNKNRWEQVGRVLHFGLTTDGENKPLPSGTLTLTLFWAFAIQDGVCRGETLKTLSHAICLDRYGDHLSLFERQQVPLILVVHMVATDMFGHDIEEHERNDLRTRWLGLLAWLGESPEPVMWLNLFYHWFRRFSTAEMGLIGEVGVVPNDFTSTSFESLKQAIGAKHLELAEARIIEIIIFAEELIVDSFHARPVVELLRPLLSILKSSPETLQKSFAAPLIELGQRLPKEQQTLIQNDLKWMRSVLPRAPSKSKSLSFIEKRLEDARLNNLLAALWMGEEKSECIFTARLVSERTGAHKLVDALRRQPKSLLFFMQFLNRGQQRRVIATNLSKISEIISQAENVSVMGGNRMLLLNARLSATDYTLGMLGYAFAGPYVSMHAWPILFEALGRMDPSFGDFFDTFVEDNLNTQLTEEQMRVARPVWSHVVAHVRRARVLGQSTVPTSYGLFRLGEELDVTQTSLADMEDKPPSRHKRDLRTRKLWLEEVRGYLQQLTP